MNIHIPKIQYSKLITTTVVGLFIISLGKAFTTDFTQMTDTSIYISIITTCGGIMGLCLKYYMSKSKAENIYKVQRGMYEDMMAIKLDYNKKMIQILKENNITQQEIDSNDLVSNINIDNGICNITNDMTESLNNHLYDTKQVDEVTNYV